MILKPKILVTKDILLNLEDKDKSFNFNIIPPAKTKIGKGPVKVGTSKIKGVFIL